MEISVQVKSNEPLAIVQRKPMPERTREAAKPSPKEELADGEEQEAEDLIYKGIVYNLEVKKVYLDPKLTLGKFSTLVGTNTTYLSNTVNQRFGVNLKTLLNRYRVEHACHMLSERLCAFHDVATLSGFSSRSVFYAAFLRETGMPPYRYRKRQGMNKDE